MPLYGYKAIDGNNEVKQGTVTAATELEVAEILKKMGLSPVSIRIQKAIGRVSTSLPALEKIAFSRFMATLIKSGTSLSDGVPVLKAETKNPLMKQILDDILYSLEQGKSLSLALGQYPAVFNTFFLTMVKAGEVSGNLGEAFAFLEKGLRAEYSLNSKIKSAMVYPAVILVAMTAIGFLMFFFVLPQIGKVFLAMTIPLPAATKFIFESAITVGLYRIQIMVGSLVGAITLFLFLKTQSGKLFLLKLLSPMPIIKPLLEQIDIARFCRIFSTLVSSAVPIIEAADIALNSLSHPKFRGLNTRIVDEIKEGHAIAESFTKYKVFPPLLIQMISAGEKSGTLDETLADMAGFYEEEVGEAVKKSTQLLEPVLMLAVGVGVGAMILMIIAPLYSVIGQLQEVR